MAASVFGRVMELANEISRRDSDTYDKPIVLDKNFTIGDQKVSIDLNINLHVYHHEANNTKEETVINL